MLILNSKIEKTPILGLQTGSQLATTGAPIINPANLQIIAYRLENNSYSNEEMFIRIDEIRELSRLGFIIDSGEDFILADDVIRIKEILDLNFNLIGMPVVDEKGNKLGKIIDFTMSLLNFEVQQLIVKRPLLKSLNNPELTIHRNLITQIDDEKITIHSENDENPLKRVEQNEENFVPNYINPFRD
ncbi:MAG: PRC-barrel domain-containing protein [bacterium]|nr:PRC-barrel domain-containing protein [bacterium]